MISYLLQGILLPQRVSELVQSSAASVWCWSPCGSTGAPSPATPRPARSQKLWRRRSSSLAVLLVLTVAGCTSRGSASQASHVVVVVEENHTLNQIIGLPQAPFLNQLASQGVLLTAYHAITHHSLPNYLAMVSGDTHGVTTSDCAGCTFTGPNLAGQLELAGVSWKAYMQGLPAPCSVVARSGAYARRHDPFMYFDGVRRSPRECHKVVPFSQFATDLAAGRLPRFAYVVPDLNHDMHDGPVSVADAWLRDFHAHLVASPSWQPDTRLVVTFDEGTGADNRVATIVTGPRVRPRLDNAAYNHYSLLRSVETVFGLPYLGHAADSSTTTIPAVATPMARDQVSEASCTCRGRSLDDSLPVLVNAGALPHPLRPNGADLSGAWLRGADWRLARRGGGRSGGGVVSVPGIGVRAGHPARR